MNKIKIFKMLFLVSIIFNITFIGGYFHKKNFSKTTPSERVGFQRIVNFSPEVREELLERRQLFLRERRLFLRYLRGDDFKPEKAFKLLESMVEKQSIMEREIGRKMIENREEVKKSEKSNIIQERNEIKNRGIRRKKSE